MLLQRCEAKIHRKEKVASTGDRTLNIEGCLSPNSGQLERCLFTKDKYTCIPFIPSYNNIVRWYEWDLRVLVFYYMAIIMTLWIGNGAVLKRSSQWQLKQL